MLPTFKIKWFHIKVWIPSYLWQSRRSETLWLPPSVVITRRCRALAAPGDGVCVPQLPQFPPFFSVLLFSFMFICMAYRLMSELCSQTFERGFPGAGLCSPLQPLHYFSRLISLPALQPHGPHGSLSHLPLPMQFSHQTHHGRQDTAQFGPCPSLSSLSWALEHKTYRTSNTQVGQVSSHLSTCWCLAWETIPLLPLHSWLMPTYLSGLGLDLTSLGRFPDPQTRSGPQLVTVLPLLLDISLLLK